MDRDRQRDKQKYIVIRQKQRGIEKDTYREKDRRDIRDINRERQIHKRAKREDGRDRSRERKKTEKEWS